MVPKLPCLHAIGPHAEVATGHAWSSQRPVPQLTNRHEARCEAKISRPNVGRCSRLRLLIRCGTCDSFVLLLPCEACTYTQYRPPLAPSSSPLNVKTVLHSYCRLSSLPCQRIYIHPTVFQSICAHSARQRLQMSDRARKTKPIV